MNLNAAIGGLQLTSYEWICRCLRMGQLAVMLLCRRQVFVRLRSESDHVFDDNFALIACFSSLYGSSMPEGVPS